MDDFEIDKYQFKFYFILFTTEISDGQSSPLQTSVSGE